MKTILVDAVHCFIIEENGKFGVFDDMYKLLETYPNKKLVLTGANEEQQKKYNFDTVSYEFFTLKHNPEKTDPMYYKILLDKYGLKNDEVLYFEHDLSTVNSAQSVGINTYFYDNDKKDIEGLKKFLDSNL